jgi:hypothetical protein
MNRSSRFSDPTSPEGRALAAAVRVALGSGLVVACGGRFAEPEPSRLPPSTTNPAATTPPNSAPGPVSQTLESCEARLEAAFPGGGAPFYVNDVPRSTDPLLVACCQQIEAAASGLDATERIRSSGCCHVASTDTTGACTPWGPPVPPAMPARLA